jgi:serine protease AprX
VKPQRLVHAQRWRLVVAAAVALGGVIAAPAAGGATATAPDEHVQRVIVQAEPGSLNAVGKTATAMGGRVVAAQQALGTVVIDLPASAVSSLRSARGVAALTLDSKVKLEADSLLPLADPTATTTGDPAPTTSPSPTGTTTPTATATTAAPTTDTSTATATTAAPAPTATATATATSTTAATTTATSTGVGPTGLPGDMTNVTKLTGAQTFWKGGYYGQGVDIALLDSGVVPVNGLLYANKLVMGPDLSFESQLPNLRFMDTFGHGTHMAGIIAGRDTDTALSPILGDNTHFFGMAPKSRIVSMKLADAHGSTDVSQVIAAIDWVVAHGHDAGLNIRVMNLSFGTDSSQDYSLDPLAHAAEVAWNKGVVVVVSAGNGDGTRLGLANPAYDPAVLAVGAQDTKGTMDRGDDAIPTFSQRGNTALGMRAPDLVAPGTSIVSLRSPGSFVDGMHGTTGTVASRFFKGSGTSQSAAVVSGAAALLLSQRPSLTPDQVKDILRRSAKPLAGVTTDAQGQGALDLTAAYTTGFGRGYAIGKLNAGGGSVDKARGRFKVKLNGVALSGELDILGNPINTTGLATDEASSSPDVLNGATWADGSWQGLLSGGAIWTGATWAGATWAGATWAGATWAGATWAGATWAGATWAGATWAGATWADAQWANDLWSSAGWE